MEFDRGTILVALGVALFVASMTASAAMAPTIDVPATDGPSTVNGNGTPGGNGTPTGDGASERRGVLVGVQGGGPGWHEYGTAYRLHRGEKVWEVSDAGSYFDVTPNGDGTYTIAFMDGGRQNCDPYDSPCAHTGFQVVDPSADPMITDEYSFPVRTQKNSEIHAAERLDSGGYVMTDMDRERLVVLDENLSVDWQWNASELYDPPEDPTKTDWLHVNDVDVVGEDRYLVSVRNANQLVIVERGEGAVEIINADDDASDDGHCRGKLTDTDGDGEIRCGDPSVLDRQHNPQWIGEGQVLVADSHNDRAVLLERGDDGDWRATWQVQSVGGLEMNWPRDADLLPNGNVLITDTLNRRIVEIDAETKEVVWSTSTQLIPYEADRLPYGEPKENLTAFGSGSTGTPTDDGTTTGGSTDSGTATDGTAGTPGDSGTGSVEARDTSVPGLSTLLVGMRAVYPGLPFWFKETQLALTILSLGLTVGGVVTHVRD